MTWTNRYQHDMTLSLRAWPCGKKTIKQSLQQPTWEVQGLMQNADGNLEAWHRYGNSDHYTWELSAEDSYRLASAGAAGARFGDMIIRTPGTAFNNTKMECWLEVPLTLNPKAWRRKEYGKGDPFMEGSDEQIGEMVKAVWENDVTRAKKCDHEYYGFSKEQIEERFADRPRREFTGLYYVTNPDTVDLGVLAGEVMKGKAIMIDKRLKSRLDVDQIDRALDYWLVPGVEPEAPGGEFNPYQLGRSVFWCKDANLPEWLRGEGPETVKRLHKEAHLEKMRSKVQKHYMEQVTERLARRYGINRERVAARLIEEGFMDWMIEQAEKIWEDPSLAKFLAVQTKCQKPVGEAVKIISFCIDSMAIRPPDPIPAMLTPEEQERKLEAQRKKLDKLAKLTPEEREKALAKKAHRERNRPGNIVKAMVAIYAQQEGREPDAVYAELVTEGIVDLLVSGLKTRQDASPMGKFVDEQRVMYERIGPEVIRLLRRCRTGETYAAWE